MVRGVLSIFSSEGVGGWGCEVLQTGLTKDYKIILTLRKSVGKGERNMSVYLFPGDAEIVASEIIDRFTEIESNL
jgi:hypothetical protein